MDYVPRQLNQEMINCLKAVSYTCISELESRLNSAKSKEIPTEGMEGYKNTDKAESIKIPEKTSKSHKKTRLNIAAVPTTSVSIEWEAVDILENIRDAFFALDKNYCFVYLNSRSEQIFGKNKDNLLGKCIWEELPDFLTKQNDFNRAWAEKINLHSEEFYPSLGAWLEMRVYPKTDNLFVYFQDTTANKQIEAALLERSHLSALGASIGIALGQSGTIPDILQRCTQSLIQHLQAANAYIWTFNPAGNYLELQASAGNSNNEIFQVPIPMGRSIIGCIAQSRQPYLSNIPNDGWITGNSDWIKQQKIAAFAGYPLIVEEKLVGVMAIMSRNPYTETIHGMLEWVANGIAVAIDRAWAREALLSRREGLLFRLANQIRNSLDLNTILETAVHEIRSLLNIDRCHFLWYLPTQGEPSLMVTHEARHPSLPSLLNDWHSGAIAPLAEKIRSHQMLRIDDLEHEPGLDDKTIAMVTRLGITSGLLLPLETRAGQLGAVICSHCRGPRPWSSSEVELLQAVVDQLAIAIDQAELYAQTHAAALAAQTQAQQLERALQNLKQTQAQLIQTEKMSSLGQLVAGVAHEINNPVNFITGNLSHASNYIQDLLGLIELYQKNYTNPVPEITEEIEAIDLEFLSEDLPKVLNSMQIGAERIRQIVLSLRNFSRLDEAEMKPVDIHEGIDNTLLILHNRLKPKGNQGGIDVIKEYAHLPKVNCYAGQLNQVFMNIIANAIDALESQTEPRIITIRTSIENGDPEIVNACQLSLTNSKFPMPNCQFLVIRIRDNGPGMNDEVKRRLFDPFFTTKPVGKGTGLGLSISYQIVVEKHGGLLKCLSEPGKGSEFVIQIPMEL